MELTATATRFLPLLAGAIALVGCGGGGASTSATAKSSHAAVKLSVMWPARSRAAATDAQSVSLSVAVGGVEAGRTVLDRPTGDAAAEMDYTFADLPDGALTTSVTAYAQAGAAGDAIAASQTSATLKAGATLLESATLTADSTGLQVTATGDSSSGTGQIAVGVH